VLDVVDVVGCEVGAGVSWSVVSGAPAAFTRSVFGYRCGSALLFSCCACGFGGRGCPLGAGTLCPVLLALWLWLHVVTSGL